MKIYFLGVGEACDGRQPNTSILLKTDTRENRGRILLDCGFSTPHHYLSLHPPVEELQMLWISHFHGDHFLGTPLLLLWFREMKRQSPLNILGPPGVEAAVRKAMHLAYPNLLDRLEYSLSFHEITPGNGLRLAESTWKGEYTEHSQPCLSLRLELNGKAIFYSGDGRPTPMTKSLAMECDIIIHEAYELDDMIPGHGSIRTCLEFARNAGVKRLALVHMQRDVRMQAMKAIKRYQEKYQDLEITVPERGSSMII
jgi:ribonuclease BN (tRNA processing enzyme)